MEGVTPINQYGNASFRNERTSGRDAYIRGFRASLSDSLAGYIIERRDPFRGPLLLVAMPVTGTVLTQDLPVSGPLEHCSITPSPVDLEISRTVARARVKRYYQWRASNLKRRHSLGTKIPSTKFEHLCCQMWREGEA